MPDKRTMCVQRAHVTFQSIRSHPTVPSQVTFDAPEKATTISVSLRNSRLPNATGVAFRLDYEPPAPGVQHRVAVRAVALPQSEDDARAEASRAAEVDGLP